MIQSAPHPDAHEAAAHVATRWRTFGVAFVAILLPMLLWTLASPLMSVPDEPSHAIRAAAVVRGEVTNGPWSENPAMMAAQVPAAIAHSHFQTCFAFEPELSADCAEPFTGDPTEIVESGTSAGVNSPVYYAIVGLPSLFLNGDLALYGMRVVNAVLCAALLAVMIMQLRTLPSSRWAILASTVAVTPMVLFLGGSINPNGVEVSAAGALFATLVVTFRTHSNRALLWERAATTVVSATLLLSTRNIALLWVVVIVAAAVIVSRGVLLSALLRRPATWVTAGAAALATVFTLAWYLRNPVTSAAATNSLPPREAAATTFARTLDFGQAWVGLFGWVDTPAHTLAIAAWSLAIGAIAILAIVWCRPRFRWMLILFLAVIVLTPPISQAAVAAQLGYIWQGRYTLAMVLCMIVACGVALDDRFPKPLSRFWYRPVIVVLWVLAAAHVATFVGALRRYVTGVNGTVVGFLVDPQWQPPGTWIGLTGLFALVIAAGTLLAVRTAGPRDVTGHSAATPSGSPL